MREPFWSAVPGHEGSYEVSSSGEVRSLDRVVPHRICGHLTIRGRILKPGTDSDGYKYVALCRDGRTRTEKIHRLVALVFLGNPEPGRIVLHKNGNPADNDVDNLYWGTYSQNIADAIKHGTYSNGNTTKTHCKRNHEFTPENTGSSTTHSGRAGRYCKTCKREQREMRQRGVTAHD